MIENSSPEVGRAAIDAYLDSVEQALLAARAPRSDRLQVLQDLESQIADMLARETSPLTDESVRAVIEKLEPPRHFADTYGNTVESTSWPTPRFMRHENLNWPLISAVSFALIPAGGLLALLNPGPFVGLLIACLLTIGFLFTPVAIWKAFKQLRAQLGKVPGRGLLLKTTIAYGALVPALVVLCAALITEGFAFFLLGFAALVYVQYLFLRRLWQSMADAIPPQPAATSTFHANGNGTSSHLGPATPMPAM
jgi:hypothetical protein